MFVVTWGKYGLEKVARGVVVGVLPVGNVDEKGSLLSIQVFAVVVEVA